MKHLILIVTLLAGSIPATDQWGSSSRWESPSGIENVAEELKSATRELAETSSEDLVRGFDNSKSDIENAMLAQQLDGAAGLFLEMTKNGRPVGELRDAAGILTELSRRIPTFGGSLTFKWQAVTDAVRALNREVGNGWGSGSEIEEKAIVGRVYWRGRVDDRIQLKIRNETGETRTISGSTLGDGVYNFTSGLPERNVEVSVYKKKGRGKVRVIQQPSEVNNFTAVIEVYDDDSGARDYELDIYWR